MDIPEDLKRYTVEPGSAVPAKTGLESDVISSMLDDPVSLVDSRSGTEGGIGGDESIVRLSSGDLILLFPRSSMATTATRCTPSKRSALMDQVPAELEVPVVYTTLSEPLGLESNNSTWEFGSAVPVNSTILIDVLLSESDSPVSY